MGDTSGHDESAPKNWSDRGRHFSNKKHEADKAGKMGGARDWSTRMKRDPKTKEV